MSEWINPGLLWFLIGLACIVAELMLPGFVVIFFGFGAWVTALLLWLGWITSFDVQLITFITATILSLILFRKQGKRYFEGKTSGKMGPGQDLEDLTGERAIATSDIIPGNLDGKVEFRGTLWQAISDEQIARGSVVAIVRRQNLQLIVKQQRKEV
jgi:membrane protein implicated in regulation of membrane protease activity